MQQQQIKAKMPAVNKKLKYVILQQVNFTSLLLPQMLEAIENHQYLKK